MMVAVLNFPIARPVRFVLQLALLLLAAASWSAEIQGRVVGITDGDTITVLDAEKHQHKVRLAYIDAPERRQPFGSHARRQLSELVFGKSVNVDRLGLDRYGRVIGRVTIEGQDINLAMITAGMAWHDYWDRQALGMRQAYARAEMQARETRLGLWSHDDPVRPREFRTQQAQGSVRPLDRSSNQR